MPIVLTAGEPATYTARALWDTLELPAPGTFDTFTIDTAASLVPGMTVTSEEITGTPSTNGQFQVVVIEQYRDEFGDFTTRTHTIPVVITGGSDPDPEPEPEPVDPAVERIARFLGQADNPDLVALAAEHLPIITAMAKAYTRGGGFTGDHPADDVAAVITAATCRLIANPEQLRYQAGSVQINDSFRGWTLAESFVLNRYRRRAR